MSIRIGGVPYEVGAPLQAGLDEAPDVELVLARPAELIAKLRGGSVEAALVSSIEAIRQPGYTVAAGLGIACRDGLPSVRAFRRPGTPIRTVALDQSSATSVALLRLLLANVHVDAVAHGIEFENVEPTRRPDELPHDLVLVVGDDALHAEPGSREPWDLGAQWRQWTGLPFVFSLWVLRPGADPDLVLPHLHAARARARQADAGAAHYELDDQDLRGLCRFWAECRALGMAPHEDPSMVD